MTTLADLIKENRNVTIEIADGSITAEFDKEIDDSEAETVLEALHIAAAEAGKDVSYSDYGMFTKVQKGTQVIVGWME